jgi:hypothetical protein
MKTIWTTVVVCFVELILAYLLMRLWKPLTTTYLHIAFPIGAAMTRNCPGNIFAKWSAIGFQWVVYSFLIWLGVARPSRFFWVVFFLVVVIHVLFAYMVRPNRCPG